MKLTLALRLARRELRGGLRGFRVFLACLALGVAAIAAVGGVREGIKSGLAHEGATLLGGDAAIELTYRFASTAERAWLSQNSLAVSEVAEFRSMAVVGTGDAARRGLTQVKAVDGAYPLYGAAVLNPEMTLPTALAGQNGLPGIVLDRLLVERFEIAPGDVVHLGEADFVYMATLVREPDNSTGGFGLGPRSLVLREDLEGSGLLNEGTLFDTKYRLHLPEGVDLDAFRSRISDAVEGARWRDARDGAPRVRFFVDRLSTFLILVGLAGLAIGGVGISAAVRTYLDAKIETIAVLKTLGASGALIFQVYLIQIFVLTLLGLALGVAIGAWVPWMLGPVIEAALPVPADFSPRLRPMLEAVAYGGLAALLFTIWPLARIEKVRPAALFREVATGRSGWPRPVFFLITGLVLAALVGLAVVLTGAAKLVLWALAGFFVAFLVLVAAAVLVRITARKMASLHVLRGWPILRMALGSLGVPGGDTGAVILSLGLGLSVLATIGQIDNNLRGAIQRELPSIAPSFFVLNIQPDQIDAITARIEGDAGVSRMDAAPMLRGVITQINGRPAREIAGDHWVLEGDRGLTYSRDLPKRSTLVDGEWWDAEYAGPPLISFSAVEAGEMGLALGDSLTMNILGRDITGTIASLREVDFSGVGMGFILSMNPSALAGAPHSFIATIYAEQTVEAAIMRDLSNAHSNITVISVRNTIEQVTTIMGQVAAAITYGALVTLITGFVVLIGAAAAGSKARNYEAALLKTLGASRARVLVNFTLRSAFLGAAAGGIAVVFGGLAGWAVTHFVMEQDFTFEPVSAIAIVTGGVVVTMLAGLGFAWRSLSLRPAQVLRSRE